jgi:hypothetical protein
MINQSMAPNMLLSRDTESVCSQRRTINARTLEQYRAARRFAGVRTTSEETPKLIVAVEFEVTIIIDDCS